MSRRATFTQAEFNAIAKLAKAGIRMALVAKPDGTKIVVPAAEVATMIPDDDLDSRLAAFAAS